MTKVPEAGKVKTRLQPFLSPKESAGLAEAFLQDAENKAKSVEPNLIIAFSPADCKDKLETILRHENTLIEQTGADLGERMFNAFRSAFENDSDAVVMIGTDSPNLPPRFIEKAFDFLENSDAVLGESEDGGYYLIGLRKLEKKIFENIEWSSHKTFQQTVRNLENGDFEVSFLQKWYDVDLPKDLKKLKKDLSENPQFAADDC